MDCFHNDEKAKKKNRSNLKFCQKIIRLYCCSIFYLNVNFIITKKKQKQKHTIPWLPPSCLGLFTAKENPVAPWELSVCGLKLNPENPVVVVVLVPKEKPDPKGLLAVETIVVDAVALPKEKLAAELLASVEDFVIEAPNEKAWAEGLVSEVVVEFKTGKLGFTSEKKAIYSTYM